MTAVNRARPPADFPWWLAVLCLLFITFAAVIATEDLYSQIFLTVAKGLGITVSVALLAFFLACLLGMGIALASLSHMRWLRQSARFYVEVIRGLPILVLLFYIAFVAAPGIVAAYNYLAAPLIEKGLMPSLLVRDFSLLARAVMALTIAYSAFIAEIFRAGIEAIPQGQVEAAKALGLSRFQRFRLIVLPQALRIVFPPLSNDFVSMVKDSSLVSVLGVADITQMAKVYASGSFRFFETYSILAYVYLALTISLSLVLRRFEQKMRSRSV
ncbi:amino acid ABC transporter permease [Rhizobium helianthi]|uniref:Amino acid ABC transporter permease n=1 Tax=Rhizobium helianthi TaxID=1132695 RepID=A0ABW4M5S9_9HYPH